VSFGSIMGVLLTLGFVLALLGVALKLLRKFAPTSTTGAKLRMEIVQRLALGPKQGIAVIRVGERLVAVSVGDGGIHRLFELEPEEITAIECSKDTTQIQVVPARVDFKSALTTALKSATGFAVALLIAAGGPRAAHAQAATSTSTSTVTTAPKPGVSPSQSAIQLAQRITNAAAQNAAKAATTGPDVPKMDLRVGNGDGLHLSGTVGIVIMMGLLTLLPTLLLMMTGFTRILIVLNFLKQALGTQSAPPTQLVAGLALILTGFVMAPTLNELNKTALTPWMDGTITQAQMLELGAKPFRTFMVKQTRRQDIETFVRMSARNTDAPPPATIDDVPLVTLTSAFVISELRTAFQIGFALFLPFIVIDVAVSAVLMSMGMFMLPPAMISLPFKLLLFVLVDGWSLIVQSLITSFR
jgi:flagellar biosynthetic protein FliP